MLKFAIYLWAAPCARDASSKSKAACMHCMFGQFSKLGFVFRKSCSENFRGCSVQVVAGICGKVGTHPHGPIISH